MIVEACCLLVCVPSAVSVQLGQGQAAAWAGLDHEVSAAADGPEYWCNLLRRWVDLRACAARASPEAANVAN